MASAAWARARRLRAVGQSLGPQETALRRQGQADDLYPPDRLAAEPRSVRLQAGTGEARRPALPRRLHQGQALRLHFRHAQALGHAADLQAAWQGGHLAFRRGAAVGRSGRRAVRRPLDGYRPVQPRPGRAAGLHRFAAAGPPVDGRMGHLWPGHREPGSARLHRADLQRHAAQRGQELVRLRVPADGLPGRAVPFEGRPGALCFQPRRHGPRDAPHDARRAGRSQPDGSPAAWPSGNAHADLAIRAGLPHAGRRARGDGYFPRAAGGPGKLRGPARREQPGQQYSLGAAAGGKGRPLRAAFRLGLGFPRHESRRGHPRRPDEQVQVDGPGRSPP